jgi:hypothetical protein
MPFLSISVSSLLYYILCALKESSNVQSIAIPVLKVLETRRLDRLSYLYVQRTALIFWLNTPVTLEPSFGWRNTKKTKMVGFDMGFGAIPNSAANAFGSIAMDGDEYVRCVCCGFGGCDVRVSVCGCTMHAVSERTYCKIRLLQYCNGSRIVQLSRGWLYVYWW